MRLFCHLLCFAFSKGTLKEGSARAPYSLPKVQLKEHDKGAFL